MEIRFVLLPLPNYYTAPAHPHATDAAVYTALFLFDSEPEESEAAFRNLRLFTRPYLRSFMHFFFYSCFLQTTSNKAADDAIATMQLVQRLIR